MFNLKNFLQAIGASILLTISISFLLGFFDLGSFGVFLFVQTILTYGSIGYFAAKWNRETPYTAAYFGAIVIVLISFVISNYIFNVAILVDSEAIGSSLSYAIIVSIIFAAITVLIQNRREGAV